MSRLLCIVSRPPYESSHSLELLETAMVGAVFDFDVSILFRGEGVWGLVKDQDASLLERRTFAKVLTAMPAYDVDKIFVCAQALSDSGLQVEQLAVPVQVLHIDAQADLIAAQDAVMGAQA